MSRFITLTLCLSLLANLAMGVVWYRSKDKTTSPQKSGTASSSAEPAPAKSVTTTTPAAKVVAPPPKRQKTWAELASLTPAELRDQLAAAGYPVEVVRAVVRAKLEESYLKEIEDNWIRAANVPYWKSVRFTAEDFSRRQNALSRVSNELAALFNEGRTASFEVRAPVAVPNFLYDSGTLSLNNIPGEKLGELRKIQTDYQELRERLYAQKSDPESSKKLALLEKEQRADLEKALSKEELLEYDLRSSPGASYLRARTEFFPLNEQEFRALAPIYIDALKAPTDVENLSPAERAKRAEKSIADADTALRAALGEERFADFVQARDPENAKLNRILQRLDLPLSAGRSVVKVRDDVSARADALTQDKSLSAEQRSAQLAALAQEAESKISSTLGPRGLAAYKQYDGRWLQALQGGAGKKR